MAEFNEEIRTVDHDAPGAQCLDAVREAARTPALPTLACELSEYDSAKAAELRAWELDHECC